MIRVHVICEGQTEQTFVRDVLSEYFNAKSISLIPSLIGKPGHKGGRVKFDRLFKDVENRLNDNSAYCTTLFDYYGLPSNFPGKVGAQSKTIIADKAEQINQAVKQKLTEKLEANLVRRFIPYVQMHEFEALLFSDVGKFSKGIDRIELKDALEKIDRSFDTPEHINDSPQTAPSKRIGSLLPEYQKTLMGSLAAIEIGLENIRKRCNLFNGWIAQLERLAG